VAKSRFSFSWRLLFLLPIPVLWCVLSQRGSLQFLENKLLDLSFRYRREIASPVKLVYVDLDTRGLQEIGERPWDREKFGLAAAALIEAGGAKAVAFDFVFSALSYSALVDPAKAEQGNKAFGRVIHRHRNILLAAQYTFGEAKTQEGARQFPFLRKGFVDRTKNDVPEMPQYPLVGPTWGRVGLIDFDTEYGGDDVPRWVPVFAQTVGPTLYHMAVQLALVAADLDEQAVRLESDRLDAVRPDGSKAFSIPLRERQLVEVNWFSHWFSPEKNPRTSLADVLIFARDLNSEKPEERQEAQDFFAKFRDAIVLIGPTDALFQDQAPTPFDREPVPKVGVHGNLLKTIVSGWFIRRLPGWTGICFVLVLTLVVTALAISGGARSVLLKVAAILVAIGYVLAALELFKRCQIVLPLTAPLGAAFTTSFAALIWQVVEEQKQKGRIKGMFRTYLSPHVVERMIESGQDPQLGGHDEVITAYFSDIQKFSAFSELLPSAKLGELLNEYLTVCTDLVTEHDGTLDKYIGDAVVAMFGAPVPLPDHAYRAALASQLVHRQLAVLREKWKGEGDKWPELVHRMRTRVGLNTGLAMIGNMGSRTRFNYTMMGDNVNLAARMESGAKSWGAYTMCTEATRQQCEAHGRDHIVFRPLGRIKVMGRSQAVPIHEIVGLKEDVTDQTRECLGLFGQGLEKYYARDFAGAGALFRRSAELEPHIPGRDPGIVSNPSLVYIGISEHFQIEPPPENWDGVYEMKEK
jgi:adenylate cyclase